MREWWLLRDYTGTTDVQNPKLKIVTSRELLELLDEAYRGEEIKIAVYELGDCVLDWS